MRPSSALRLMRFAAPLLRRFTMVVVACVLAVAGTRAQGLGTAEVDQLTAPIALYPDTLLAQVLIASTYPAEVAQAGQWAKENSGLGANELGAALEQQTWDPSVKALIQVPTVLEQMNARMDWTQKLGDAFLAQEAEVMDSVQRLRQTAQNAGQLMTSEQQRVVMQGQTIVIEQANPQVMYVPSYDPAVAYGGWPYPSFPPYYWPTPPGYAFARGLAWGAGFAIGAAVWDNAFDWNNHDINVNVNRNDFTNINSNRANNIANSRSWQHNSANRRGTNYRDTATRERYGKTNTANANARRESRGFDQARVSNQLTQQRGSGQLAQQRGAGHLGQQRGSGQLAQQRASGQLTQQRISGQEQPGSGRSSIERRGQTSSFDGLQNGASTRNFSDRGRSSRQSMAQNISARGGDRSSSRPTAASPGGGGGGRAGGAGRRGR